MKLPLVGRRRVKTQSAVDPRWMERLPNLNTGWAFVGQVSYNILVLIFIAMLFGYIAQFSDYLNFRGEVRDQERDRAEEQQREFLCELIANLPAEPDSELFLLNERLECTTVPESPGEAPGEVPAPSSSEAVPTDDPGMTQDNGAAPTAGGDGVPQPTGTPGRSTGSATTVAPPATASPTSTSRPQPTVPPTTAPQPTPEVPTPVDPAPGPGGLLPGVDVQLCLPVVGCVLV